ncbi:prokineticin domain-containing protein [Nephila pilipes]|uniref:Prokineticin domain-containing protein n=1 Tax=Nephila pilipes TaxID=299642 RepID=A0A8X6TIV6_NEPPI|nr:prokineticin domain-containing protein [Nephila pilipes]
MGLLGFLFLFLTISYASADGMRSCITDENCEEGECCISMAFLRGFCHTLGDEGDHCITEPAKTKYGNKNIFGCPCKDNFKCIPDVITEEDGKTIMKNFSCKKLD